MRRERLIYRCTRMQRCLFVYFEISRWGDSPDSSGFRNGFQIFTLTGIETSRP
jgi:hypothetical protein